MTITTRSLAAIKPGQWLTHGGDKGAGRLAAFGMRAGGVAFYFRYTKPDGKRDAIPLGHYDQAGKAGLSLKDASAQAGEYSKRYQAGARDLRAVLAAELAGVEEAKEAARHAKQARANRGTLADLFAAYVEQLRRDGKGSATSVEASLQRHVLKVWPKLCKQAAEDVSADDLLGVVAAIVDAGKLREAAKVRSYLKAAYSAAIRARQDARGSQTLRELKLQANPARDLVTITGATQARERALSLAELRAYWHRISSLPAPTGALLQFHILTGGQRVQQLARATFADVDSDTKTLRLRDPKGRRSAPRIHDVPLLPAALEAVALMRGGLAGPFVFTVTAGKSGASYHGMEDRIQAVAEQMLEAGELTGGPFTVGDLRRTIETRLAGAGVSLEIRAQLQSHGLGGIQARHYDRHDYLDEKRRALETLLQLVSAPAADVVPIKRRARS